MLELSEGRNMRGVSNVPSMVFTLFLCLLYASGLTAFSISKRRKTGTRR